MYLQLSHKQMMANDKMIETPRKQRICRVNFLSSSDCHCCDPICWTCQIYQLNAEYNRLFPITGGQCIYMYIVISMNQLIGALILIKCGRFCERLKRILVSSAD